MIPLGTLTRAALGRRGTGFRAVADAAACLPAALGLGESLAKGPVLVPSAFDMSRAEVLPDDQGPENSCAGRMAAKCIRLAALTAGAWLPELSAHDAYWKSRLVWGGHRTDAGTFIGTTVHAVTRHGIAPDAARRSANHLQVNRSTSRRAQRLAHDVGGHLYAYRVHTDGQVRAAMVRGHAVGGGFAVDVAFLEDAGPRFIERPSGDTLGLGHAVAFDGYDERGCRCINSWGIGWRDRGKAWLSWDYVLSGELWAFAWLR